MTKTNNEKTVGGSTGLVFYLVLLAIALGACGGAKEVPPPGEAQVISLKVDGMT